MATPKVLVVFYSRSGNTEKLAEAIAEGALEEGAEVTVRRVNEIVSEDIIAKVSGWKEHRDRMQAKFPAPTPDDVAAADAVVFGTPTRFGNVSSELKAFVDSLGGLWAKGKMNGKVGAAFTSTSTPHGGNESTILTMYNFMAHFGMVIVPPGYSDPAVFGTSTPYGASSVSGGDSQTPPSEGDISVAKHQGKLVAKVARALKQASEA